MKQKLLWLLFAFMIIIAPHAKVAAQTSASGQLSFSVPGTFSACNTDTVCVKVYNNKSVKGVTYTGPVKLEVTIPGGALMVYKGLTATTAANAAVTNVVYTAGTGKLTADVALPALGAFTEVCFLVQPDCNIGTLTPLPVFTALANYPFGYPDATQNVVAATANVGKGILSVAPPIYPSLIHFNTEAPIAFSFPDVTSITNTGYGDIIEVIHTMVIPAKFTFDSYYLWTPNFATNTLVVPFSNTLLPDGSREIKVRLSGSLLGADNVFGPNEAFNPGAYITSKPPVECGQWQIKHTYEYSCGTGKPSCEPPVTTTSTRTMRDNFVNPVGTLDKYDKPDGCNDAKKYEFTFTNNGEYAGYPGPTNGGTYPNKTGVAYDVRIGASFTGASVPGVVDGSLVDISNLTINGVAISPFDALITVGASLDNVPSFQVDFKDKNTNPAYGLVDIDGDGFLDDMPAGTTIPVKMLFKTDFVQACDGANFYIYGFMIYKDICRDEKTRYAPPYDTFGFAKQSAVTQTSVNTFGVVSANGSAPTAPQTATFQFNYKTIGSFTISPTSTAKLKIRQSAKVEVDRTSVKLNGTTLTLSSVQGAGATIGTQPGGNAAGADNVVPTDTDSLLIFDVPAAGIAALVDGTVDNLEYQVVAYNCVIRQDTKSSDNWSLCLKFKDCGAAGGGEIDLSCRKAFVYSINRGCGVKPCYVNNAKVFRKGPIGWTSTAELANIAPYDSLRSYECDTLMYAVSTYLNGDWPAGEANGFYTTQAHPSGDGNLSFNMVYPTNAANIAAGRMPMKFIENESKIVVWNIDPATKAKISIAKTVSVQANDFSTKAGVNIIASNQADGVSNQVPTSLAYSNGVCANDPSYAILCGKGPIGGYTYGDASSMHSGLTYYTLDNKFAATNYTLLAGKALFDEGFTTKIWNDDNYLIEYQLKWKPRDDANWQAQEDVYFAYGSQTHYGNYYTYDTYGVGSSNFADTDSPLSSYFGSCGATNKSTLIVAKDLFVENPNASYVIACSSTVCNKLYFDSFGGNYFRVGEVRVPYKLSNIKVTLPSGFSLVPGTVSIKTNTGCAVSAPYTNITASATSGVITFTNTAGGDFPRMDDCAGKTTAYEFCYQIQDDNSGVIKANKKINTVFNLTEEGGNPYVLKDSALVSNQIPDLRISSVSPELRNSDGGTCQAASYDFTIYNESDVDASNVHVAVDKSATVTPIVSITDMVGAIDSVKAYTSGSGGLIAYIGKLAARDSVRITVKGNTTACTGKFDVLLDWACAYPALAASDIVSLSAASAHEDIANASFDAADPKMLSRPVTNTVLKIEDLCGTKDVEFEVRNADLPNLFKLNGKFTLPSGMTFVAGSMTMTQPNGTVATPQAVTPTVAGQVVSADFSALAPFNTACGLTGSDTTTKNNVRIKFKIEFGSCPGGLSQELKFEGSAENYCGKKATTLSILPIVYVGTGGNTNTYKVSSLSQTFKICAAKNEKQPLTETLTVTNLGGGGAPSTTVAGIDSVTVTMPFNSSQMLANNFVLLPPNAAVPITINAAGNPTFKVAVPAGVAVGGTFPIGITFDLTPLVDKLCEVSTTPPFCFFSEFTSRVPLVCAENPALQCTSSMPVLSKGAELVTKAFECCYVSIGSTVFDDKANNGVQDATDPGIPGLLVTLYKADGVTVVATTTTGTDGKYLFKELQKGQYIVGVTPSAAIPTSSTNIATSGADNQTDKDDNGTQATSGLEARSPIITLTPDGEPFGGQETDVNAGQDDALPFGGDKSGDMTVDFGFFTPYSVGSHVFVDKDNDGIKDAGEAGIPNLLVTLFESDGTTVVATTTTDANGNYVFNNLGEGTYIVGVTPNATQTLASSPTPGGDDANKGIQATVTGISKSAPVTLGPGLQPLMEGGSGTSLTTSSDANTNSTLDFGFLAPMSIGSTAFNDKNNDGIQAATGEPGIPNLDVTLYAADGSTVVATTTTDANGDYIFRNLQPGSYVVGVKPNTAQPTSSTPASDTDSGIDGNDNGTQGASGTEAKSGIIALALNSESITEAAQGGTQDNGTANEDINGDMTVDFGFFTPLSIGSTVFIDTNNDGIQSGAGEVGISGVIMKLYKGDGITPVINPATGLQYTVPTDANGDYIFKGLGEGDYVVGATPNGAYPTSSTGNDPVGSDVDNTDNGIQGTSGTEAKSVPITLTVGGEPTGAAESGQGGAQDNAAGMIDANGNMTVDFGFFHPMSIGSTVFIDNNNDGKQVGPGEIGISGVLVNLYKADGTTFVASTTTDGNGNYKFEGLSEGSYVVGVVPDAGFPVSSYGAGGDDQKDGDDNGNQPLGSGTEAKSAVIVLALGTEPTGTAEALQNGSSDDADDSNGDMTIDFGFFKPVSIGSTVFEDKNNNGTQDGTDAGLPGLTVKLYKADGTPMLGPDGVTPVTTTTDPNGNYLFKDLPPGTYIVGVTPNSVQVKSSTDIATTPFDNQTDSDDNGVQAGGSSTEARSVPITLAAGTEPTTEPGQGGAQDDLIGDSSGDMTVDFGFYTPVSVGSTAFKDANNNGKQDPGEGGIPGLIVKLYDETGASVINPATGMQYTTTTDMNGDYIFKDIPAGKYIIGITPNAALPQASSTVGGDDDGVDSDNNGTQVGGAPGTESFSKVITLASGTEPTGTETGQGKDQDTGALDANGDMTIDFGFYAPVSIGSTVFLDKNNDGIMNGTDSGIVGATVELFYDANGDNAITGAELTPVATMPTDGSGNYFFDKLPEGKYQVAVTPIGTATLSSTTTVTADNSTDSDDNGTQATDGAKAFSPIIDLSYGNETTTEAGQGGTQDNATPLKDKAGDMTVDFGFFAPVSIGSTAFADVNNDGKQNPGELGIPGLAVTLFAADGTTVIATTTTDSNGDYIFKDIPEGTYQIGIMPNSTLPKSSTTANTDPTTDLNNNGTQPAGVGTMAMSGPITLTPGTMPTGETGTGGIQDDTANGGDANGNMTIDFGFYQPVSLGSTAFNDANNNGKQDAGEAGIPGLPVNLYQADGVTTVKGPDGITPLTTVTDGNGDYIFKDIPAGTYVVGIKPNSTYPRSSTTPDVVTDNSVDLDDNGKQAMAGDEAKSTPITLAAGTESTTETGVGGMQDDTKDADGDMTVDFGFFKPFSLGNLVWSDTNNDGVKDPSEAPLAGLTVKLYNGDGTPYIDPATGLQARTETDVNGNYLFKDLPAGSYKVGVTPLNPNTLSSAGTFTGDNKDHGTQVGAPGSEILSGVIPLTADDLTIDFGLFVPVSIGSTVFIDANNDGVQQNSPQEAGIFGAVVNLYKAGDLTTVIATTMTDAFGNYIFKGLPEGQYVVGVIPSVGYPFSSTGNGSDNQVDKDDNGIQASKGAQTFSSPIDLKAGMESTADGTADDAEGDANGDMTVDFGFYRPVAIGSTAFVDLNGDGKQGGAGEDGIPGLVVNLYQDKDGDGVLTGAELTPIKTINTDGNGNYLFDNLAPGSYVVGVTPNAANPYSAITNGSDNGVDGDNNGSQAAGPGTEAKSGIIKLLAGTEPTGSTGEGAQNSSIDDAADVDGDMTVDFGFVSIKPLSVDLISFTGTPTDETINLTWKTANEKDFSHFNLQRSENAKEFGTIAKVAGIKSSIYNHADVNPIVGDNYYRLSMVNNNGTADISKIISVYFEKGGNYVVVENPANAGEFKLTTNLTNPSFTLVSATGSNIAVSSTQAGKNAYSFKVSNPVAGTYFLNIVSNGKLVTKKILMQ